MNEKLLKDLNKNNLCIRKIFFYNTRKNRYTLLVEPKDKKNHSLFVLKWNAPGEHLIALQNEIQFYKTHPKLNCLPEVINAQKHYVILKYYQSKTLRDWVANYRNEQNGQEKIFEHFNKLTKQYSDALHEIYLKPENESITIDARQTHSFLMQSWNRILTSGPMHTSRTRLENCTANLLSLFLKPIVNLYFKKLIHKNKSLLEKLTCIIHGDLHLNNIIIISQPSQLKIIDWENCGIGNPLVDIAYNYAMLYFLLDGLPEHQKQLSQHMSLLFKKGPHGTKECFDGILKIFIASIRTNRRFGINHKVKDMAFHNFLLPYTILKLTLSLK